MKQKKIVLIILALIVIILIIGISLPGKKSTTSRILVHNKGSNGHNYWIEVTNPYEPHPKKFKINVEKTTWQLLETSKEYFATYEYKTIEKNVELENIHFPK
ncbi:hypothetical protein ABES03_21880 [Neobacillus rhizosphaerae]|uniref:hypothetical protein n=1 Tax=Neobacillus rhizosphaerae TaxID=2880965 RepID=UPI003D26B611